MGPHWLEVKAAKGYTRKLGIWAPEKNIEAAIKLAQETQAQREAKRIVSRAQREKQEAKYRKQFAEAVYVYLDFASRYEKLARKIAQGTAEQATVVGSERVGRTKKLTLEEKRHWPHAPISGIITLNMMISWSIPKLFWTLTAIYIMR